MEQGDRFTVCLREPLANQRGAVLVVGLMLLLVLTLFGVASMQMTTLQERMAGNMREQEQAFQGAEAALRAGERFLATTPILPAFTGVNGLYGEPDPATPLWRRKTTWGGDSSRPYSGPVTAGTGQARFIIERLPYGGLPGQSIAPDEEETEGNMYRVTARGEGGLGQAVVVLESTCLK